jgi:hypothetical protein
MHPQDARREVAAARTWLTQLRFVGTRGWSEIASWYSVYPTYDEAVEAAELAVEQAEERLVAELSSNAVE